jgi:hypothetical protein
MTNAVVFDPSLGGGLYLARVCTKLGDVEKSDQMFAEGERLCPRDAYDSQPAATHWT